MSKAEALHELYNLCSEINFDDSHEILSSAKSEEEADFSRPLQISFCSRNRKR